MKTSQYLILVGWASSIKADVTSSSMSPVFFVFSMVCFLWGVVLAFTEKP